MIGRPTGWWFKYTVDMQSLVDEDGGIRISGAIDVCMAIAARPERE
jgi:hypothetical protein